MFCQCHVVWTEMDVAVNPSIVCGIYVRLTTCISAICQQSDEGCRVTGRVYPPDMLPRNEN